MFAKLADDFERLGQLENKLVDVDTIYENLNELVATLKQDSRGLSPEAIDTITRLAKRPDLSDVDRYVDDAAKRQEKRFASVS